LDTKNYIIFRNAVENFHPKKIQEFFFFYEGKIKEFVGIFGNISFFIKKVMTKNVTFGAYI